MGGFTSKNPVDHDNCENNAGRKFHGMVPLCLIPWVQDIGLNIPQKLDSLNPHTGISKMPHGSVSSIL